MFDRNIVTEREAVFRRAVQGDAKTAADDFLTRLVKIIPAEVMGAFSVAEAVVANWTTSAGASQRIAAWGVFLVILTATPLYLRYQANISRWRQVMASCFAFVAWAAGTAGPPFDLSPDIRTLVLVLAGLFLPLVRIDARRDS